MDEFTISELKFISLAVDVLVKTHACDDALALSKKIKTLIEGYDSVDKIRERTLIHGAVNK